MKGGNDYCCLSGSHARTDTKKLDIGPLPCHRSRVPLVGYIMRDQATIVDFLGASLKGLEQSNRAILSPNEQNFADGLAAALDNELETMVKELETVASCQQEAEEDEDLRALPPFEAFCVGLKRIGEALLPHLASEFSDYCANKNAPPAIFLWVLRARADAFVAYLLQIAQVHGLAFDDKLERVGKSEQIALAHLGADLRVLMLRELDAFVK